MNENNFLPKVEQSDFVDGRVVKDFSGFNWKMEKMRVGQGVAEEIHLLLNEHSGNNFSWNPAKVPGDVYTDLYLAGEIDDPYFGRNMAKTKWVEEYEWWYNYCFNVSPSAIGKHFQLLFEGVDYSCDVWLNGHYLGRHEGMYSYFEFDVTKYLNFNQPHAPANLLTVKLDPPPKNQKNFAGMKHNFAGDYLTGVIPFGIWRPVKLIATDKVKIDNYRAEYKIDGNNANASFDVQVSSYVNKLKNLIVAIKMNDGEQTITCEKTVEMQYGKNDFKFDFTIENAKLWWPFDLGESFQYDLEISVVEDGHTLDSIEEKTGVREVTMAKNPGFTEEEVENPWTFVVNGKPMFLRSACWTQPSFFYGRNSEEKYRMFLEKVKKANINNLRIFGWHPAETSEFYNICDELGITVWTNYAFATQVFRSDLAYLEKVEEEITRLLIQRRNHPSTLMWMGGEEVYFTEEHVHSDNRKIMEWLGNITNKLTNVPYADASPLSSRFAVRMGYAPKESSHANGHFYAAGAVLMEDFYPNLDFAIIPELTAASFPNVESLKKFIPENEMWPLGLSYGYHMADIDVLKNLNYEVFGDIKMGSLEEFVEATQIAQGTIAQFALESFRRRKPHVSGVSLCHFNTNWPICKWEIVDYYGVEKRSYDYVKRCYNPLLPSLEFTKRRFSPNEEFTGNLYIINDLYKSYDNVTYSYQILNHNKDLLKSDSFTISIGENVSDKIGEISYVLPSDSEKNFYVTLKVEKDSEVLSENEYCLLIGTQEEAKEGLKQLYLEMRKGIDKYGKGYYRYNPEIFKDL